MADTLTGRRKKATVNEVATGRRARLRKQQIAEMKTPQTTGNLERTDKLGSLLMFGAPEGEVAKTATKTAAKFGPKGFKAAKSITGKVSEHVMRVLKPILGKSYKAAK